MNFDRPNPAQLLLLGIVVPEASDERAIGGLTCENLCVCSAGELILLNVSNAYKFRRDMLHQNQWQR